MELIIIQVVLPFIKKYWSYILNVLLVIVIICGYKLMSSNSDAQAQKEIKAQAEFTSKLNDVIFQKSDNEQKLLSQINEITRLSHEQMQQLFEDHNRNILELNDLQTVAVQNVIKQKQIQIKARVDKSYTDSDKVANETAKKFGFKVIREGDTK